MAVELRSLRISSDFDSSSYVSGMNAKVTADNAGAQSSKAAGAAIEGLKSKVSSAVPLLERLSRTYVDGYGSAAKFNTVIQQLARSQDTNETSVAHLEAVYDGIQKKFGLVADASELAARGYTGLATAIENVNSRLSQSGVAESATAIASRIEALRQQFDPAYVSAQRLTGELNDLAEAERLGVQISGGYEAALDALVQKHDAVAAAARKQSDEYARLAQAGREAQQAEKAQANINQTMGVGSGTGLRASDSAAVFQEQLARQEEIARQRLQQEADNFSTSLQQSFNFGGAGSSARDSASVFSAEFARLEQLQQQQAQQRGTNFTADLNERLGVDGNGTSAKASASAFEDAARAADELGRRVAGVRAQIDPLGVAQDRLNKALAEYEDLARRGAISSDDLGKAQGVARQQFDTQRKEIERQQKRGVGGLPGYQLTNLMYQGTDVAQSLALGMPFSQVALQQGPQIAQIFAADSAALKGLIGAVGGTTIAITAAVAIVAAGTKAWMDYAASVKEVDSAAKGLGQATAGSSAQMEAAAQAGANAANISIKSARSLEAQFLQTGKIGSDSFQGLIALSRNFATTLGTDSDTANEKLTSMFADPANAAQTLWRQYGLIDAATAQYVSRLVSQNRQTEAQQVLLNALPARLASATEASTAFGRVWLNISTWTSNTWDNIGKVIDRAVAVPDLAGQVDDARKQLAADTKTRDATAGSLVTRIFGNQAQADVDRSRARYDDLNEQLRRKQQREAEQQRQRQYDALQAPALDYAATAPATEDVRQRRSLEDTTERLRRANAIPSDVSTISSDQRADIAASYDAAKRALDTYMTSQEKAQALAQIDIKIENARNPAIRANLEAERQRIQLAGEQVTAQQAANQIDLARNQVIQQTIASGAKQAADMRDEIAIRNKLNAQVAAGTITSGEAQQKLQVEIQLRPLIAAAATLEGDAKKQLLDVINQLRAGYDGLAAAQKVAAANDYIRSQKDQIELSKTQLSVVGQSEVAQARAVAQLQAEQQIRQMGLDTSSKEAAQIRSNASALADLNAELQKSKDAWNTYKQAGSDAIDTLFDGFTKGDKLGDIGKNLLSGVEKAVVTLGAENPLKNMLFGTNLGTLGDLFNGGNAGGILGGLGKSVSSMNVTAASVVINGGVAGSIGGPIAGVANDNKLTGGTPLLSSAAAAIKSIESGGDYSKLGPLTKSGDRAYGAYQVMGANIPSWTASATGQSLTPSQFLASKSAQDAVFNKYFGASVSKYGNQQDAASVWFTGRPLSQGAGASDMLGTTGTAYVQKFNAALGKLGDTATATTQNLGTFGNGLGQLGQNLSQSVFPAAPTASGSGDGLFGWLGNLFAPSANSILSTSAQARAAVASGRGGLFSVGGFTGYGAVNEPAGVVHRGEVVWSQRDVARAGGVGVVDAMRLGMRGYSEGGPAGLAPVRMPRIGAANSNTPAPVNVEIHNYSNASVSQEETTDARGNRQVKFFMADQVGDALGTKGGGAAKALRNKYGVKQKGIPR